MDRSTKVKFRQIRGSDRLSNRLAKEDSEVKKSVGKVSLRCRTGPLWVSSLFVNMYLQHIEMNIETDDIMIMTLNECLEIGNWKTLENWTYWWHVPAVVAGICHHRSLTDDTKHQVALNIYELDVFPLQILGGLRPPSQNSGVWEAAPPSQNRKFFEKFSKNFEKILKLKRK